jgi:Txe/YoeB family toxin of Txe-Axe toxin-antitoxin module
VKISVTRGGWEDYITWSNDRTILKRINRMIEEAARDPAPCIGTPEPGRCHYCGSHKPLRRDTTCRHLLAHPNTTNAQVNDLCIRQWRYLPLTRTQRKLLTCGFATPQLSPALCVARYRARSVRRARRWGILNGSTRHASSVPDMRSCRTSAAATTTSYPHRAEPSAPGGVGRTRPRHLIEAQILGQASPLSANATPPKRSAGRAKALS